MLTVVQMTAGALNQIKRWCLDDKFTRTGLLGTPDENKIDYSNNDLQVELVNHYSTSKDPYKKVTQVHCESTSRYR